VVVFLLLAACALLAAVLALALLREIRLRRALEALLQKILNTWRTFHVSKHPSESTRTAEDGAGHRDDQL
jgi:hypothetical protein